MNILIGSVFVAGILSFFAPCIVPLIPVYIGILTEGGSMKTRKLGPLVIDPNAMLRTMLFVLGLSTSFVIMGFGAGAFGSLLQSPWLLRILGLIVILMGLHQMGLLKINLLDRTKKLDLERSRKSDLLGAFLLGFTFSFGWTPCVGSVLGMVLGLSMYEGQALLGGFYMFIYSLGLMIPFFIITLFSTFVINHLTSIEKHLPKIRVIGGLLIVVMGVLLMFDKINWLITVLS